MARSIQTPDYSHLSVCDFEQVYEPAEDSFLLLDAIEAQIEALDLLRPALCVEVGPGSGIISAGIGSFLKSGCFIVAVDINPMVSGPPHTHLLT
jgi:release factor glutamine methyltransferase